MPENIPFEKKELLIVVHNPNNLPIIDFHELKELQGDLKITTPAKIEKLMKSIIKYGIFVPKFTWIDNGTHYIEDGHQTIKALAELEKGGYTIPTIPYVEIQAKDRKDAGEKLLMINSRFADINPETSFFKDFDIGLEFMDEIEIPELELDFEDVGEEIEEDEVLEVPEEPVTQVGDLWLLGKHRVLCGDATKAEDVERLMHGEKADMVFTDPPYGLDIVQSGNIGISAPIGFDKVKVKGIVKARQYEEIKGDNKPFDPRFLLDFADKIILWGANNYASRLPDNSHWIVWDKKCEKGADHNNFSDVELAWTNIEKKSCIIYRYLWSGLLREGKRDIELSERAHPTQKPVGLTGDILKDYSKENDTIADLFLGSGTTLIATHQLNRICYGMEIEPKYVDVTCQRFFNLTGIDPVRESDSMKWSNLQQ